MSEFSSLKQALSAKREWDGDVYGRLKSKDGRRDIHNVVIEIYSKSFFSTPELYATANTNDRGEFHFKLPTDKKTTKNWEIKIQSPKYGPYGLEETKTLSTIIVKQPTVFIDESDYLSKSNSKFDDGLEIKKIDLEKLENEKIISLQAIKNDSDIKIDSFRKSESKENVSNTHNTSSSQKKVQMEKTSGKVVAVFKEVINAEFLELASKPGAAKFLLDERSVPRPANWDFTFKIAKGIADITPSILVSFFEEIGNVIYNFFYGENEELEKKEIKKLTTSEVIDLQKKSSKNSDLTEQDLVELITQFTDPHYYKKGKTDDEFLYEFDFRPYEKRNTKKGVPDYFSVTFIKKKDESDNVVGLGIKKILIKDWGEKEATTYDPKDKEKFKIGLQKLGDAGFALGEIGAHLGISHLNTGMINTLLLRNFRKKGSPILNLITEFCKGIGRINEAGEQEIFDADKGILSQTQLKQKGLNDLLEYYVTRSDYTKEPSDPLFDGDRLGHIKKLVYSTVKEATDNYLEKHKKTILSDEYIFEINALNDDILKNGLYRQKEQTEYLDKSVIDTEKDTKHLKTENDEKIEIDIEIKEEKINTKPKLSLSIEPIIKDLSTFDEDKDWERLKQFLIYFIYLIIYHHFIHMAQELYGGVKKELYFLIGSEFVDGKRVSDWSEEERQKIFASALVAFEKRTESMLEDKGVPEEYIKAFKSKEDLYKKLFVNIYNIPPTVMF